MITTQKSGLDQLETRRYPRVNSFLRKRATGHTSGAWSFLLSLLLIDSAGPCPPCVPSTLFRRATGSADWKRTRPGTSVSFFFLALFLFFCLPCSASARFYSAFLIVEARSPLDTHTRTIAGYARRALANASKVPLCFAAFPVWKGYPISLDARRCGSDKELIRSLRHAFQEL